MYVIGQCLTTAFLLILLLLDSSSVLVRRRALLKVSKGNESVKSHGVSVIGLSENRKGGETGEVALCFPLDPTNQHFVGRHDVGRWSCQIVENVRRWTPSLCIPNSVKCSRESECATGVLTVQSVKSVFLRQISIPVKSFRLKFQGRQRTAFSHKLPLNWVIQDNKSSNTSQVKKVPRSKLTEREGVIIFCVIKFINFIKFECLLSFYSLCSEARLEPTARVKSCWWWFRSLSSRVYTGVSCASYARRSAKPYRSTWFAAFLRFALALGIEQVPGASANWVKEASNKVLFKREGVVRRVKSFQHSGPVYQSQGWTKFSL